MWKPFNVSYTAKSKILKGKVMSNKISKIFHHSPIT